MRVGGIAKGSGMIHPNMATMLSVITSDVDADEQLWREVVRRGAINSFNQVEERLLARIQVLQYHLMAESPTYTIFCCAAYCKTKRHAVHTLGWAQCHIRSR